MAIRKEKQLPKPTFETELDSDPDISMALDETKTVNDDIREYRMAMSNKATDLRDRASRLDRRADIYREAANDIVRHLSGEYNLPEDTKG